MTFKETQEKLVLLARKYGRDYTGIRYEATRFEHRTTEPVIGVECSLYIDGLGGSHTAPTWEEAFGKLDKYIAEKGIEPVNPITVGTQAPE